MKACHDAIALCESLGLGEVDPEHGPLVPAERGRELAAGLKALGYDYFVTCVATHLPAVEATDDEPGVPERFLVAYRVRRMPKGHFAFRFEVEQDCPSMVAFWSGADWHEREQYDLVGVRFEGHPDLRRIMMPEDWEGHPLRKDYAIETRHFPWR